MGVVEPAIGVFTKGLAEEVVEEGLECIPFITSVSLGSSCSNQSHPPESHDRLILEA
jgi:hypothetical protein